MDVCEYCNDKDCDTYCAARMITVMEAILKKLDHLDVSAEVYENPEST